MEYHLPLGRNVGELNAAEKADSNLLFLTKTSIFNGSFAKQRIGYNGVNLTFLPPRILRSQLVSARA